MGSISVATPLGRLTLSAGHGALTSLTFPRAGEPPLTAPADAEEDALLRRGAEELAEYFAGTRRVFDLPLSPVGSAFDQQVWRALQTVPYGGVCTYGQLAALIGNPRACRAVGMANHRNPLPIFIPCHRCVGARGQLTGYAGGLERKQFLLELEAR
jgi:methylated-DNA-[protein]-cysteine S-methyltransferase